MYLVLSSNRMKGPLFKQDIEMCPGKAEVNIMMNDPRREILKIFKCGEENLLSEFKDVLEDHNERLTYERLKRKFEQQPAKENNDEKENI